MAGVGLEAGFESGQIQKASESLDGFFIVTVPRDQKSDEYIATGSGGFAADSSWDTKVVQGETVGNDYVLPRAGSYFLRSSIAYSKNYLALNNNSRDKPRSTILLTNREQQLPFDEEGWIGFSLHLPANFEHETGVKDHRGTIQLLSVNAHPSSTFFTLGAWVPKSDSRAHWFLQVQTDSESVKEGATTKFEEIDLGPVTEDLGKWTDFVIRARANPFSVSTNPSESGIANSVDKWYQGNRGIMQVWKTNGPSRRDGTREMKLLVDRVGEPIGMVPRAGENLRISFRIYKYGWKFNDTTVKGPVWVGFDEIRYGTKDQHGTSFKDVVPGGKSELSSFPKPPAILQ